MPSISAVNPSLTIMAQALRTADHLKTRSAGGLAARDSRRGMSRAP